MCRLKQRGGDTVQSKTIHETYTKPSWFFRAVWCDLVDRSRPGGKKELRHSWALSM